MPDQNRTSHLVFLISLVLLAGLTLGVWWLSRPRTLDETGANLREQIAAVLNGRSDTIHIEGREVSDAEFLELIALPGLRVLQLDQGRISDNAISALEDDSPIEHLRLRHSPVGDPGLLHIARLKHLRFLNLPHAAFTDAGLNELAGSVQLELFRFGSPNISDAGLAPLADIPSLRFLHIIAAPITDAGLEHVQAMQHLESFYLDETQVTEEGLGDLAQARRDLHIHWDQRHIDSDPRGRDHHH